MLRKKLFPSRKTQGDTLIEVLFATATASLIIVITLVIMNRNLAQIQMGVEITFVRQAIDSQAEVLRYLRDQYKPGGEDTDADDMPTKTKLWRDLTDQTRPGSFAQDAATPFGACQPPPGGNVTAPAAGKAFYINNTSDGNSSNQAETDAADIGNIVLKPLTNNSRSETYARPGQGLWIESINPDFGTRHERYVDFHIRACWEPPFSGPEATLGTIVRLYYEVL